MGIAPKSRTHFVVAGRYPLRRLVSAAMSMRLTSTRLHACSLGEPSTSLARRKRDATRLRRRSSELPPQSTKKLAASASNMTQMGNRAKAYLYCLETRCPRTGWMVPLVPSWVISRTRKVIGRLKPNPSIKTYDIEIVTGVSDAELAEAELGTLRDGRVVHPMNPEKSGVEIEVVRGDFRDEIGKQRQQTKTVGNQ